MASDQKVLLTVILHHDQSKNLEEILSYTKKTGFYRDFPPEGAELVSWVVAMSFGFIIQLRAAPEAIRNVNLFFKKRPGAPSAMRSIPPMILCRLRRNSGRTTHKKCLETLFIFTSFLSFAAGGKKHTSVVSHKYSTKVGVA